ncbi:MAG: hypothetical protein ACRDWA_02040 [Acidimicrobiia bacterium]
MKGLLRLYPQSWRRRYGREVAELAELSPGWRTQVDLLLGAIDAWIIFGGGEMKRSVNAIAAALMVLPSIFLTANLVGELRGQEGSEFLPGLFQSPIGEAVVVLGPLLALLVIAGTTIRFEASESGILLTLSLTRPQILLVVAAAAVAGAFLGYAFLENFVPRTG